MSELSDRSIKGSSMKALAIIGLTQLIVFCNGQEICSSINISNERRFQMQELSGLWYQHFTEDSTFFNNIIPTDGKLYFMTFGDNAIKYFYGRNQSGPGCTEIIFLDRQRTPGIPCVLVQLISPEVGEEAAEFIYSLLPGNDQLLLSFCQNPPTCTIRVAAALSRRSQICSGERELFLRKFRELGIPVSLNKQLDPTINDCTMTGLENVEDKTSRGCNQVTQDAMNQLHGRGHSLWHDLENRRYRY